MGSHRDVDLVVVGLGQVGDDVVDARSADRAGMLFDTRDKSALHPRTVLL